jgi:hypothetical protein
MNTKRFTRLLLLPSLMLAVTLACGLISGGETPEPAQGSQGDHCGDGVCDDVEQANPSLCPQDCKQLPSEEKTSNGSANACAAGEWLLVVNGCADVHGNAEPSSHICSSFGVCLTVDEQCNIRGNGQGQYDQDTCAFTSPLGCMSYEVSCPDFPISVSGEIVSNTVRIQLDASQVFEQTTATEICTLHTQLYSGPFTLMQSGYGSAIRNGGGYFCEIEARDGAHAEVSGLDAADPEHSSYNFSVDLHEGCTR